MATVLRGVAALGAVACLAVGLAACGEVTDSGDETAPGEGVEIGLLLPDNLGRWEGFDRPAIERSVAELCGDCTMEVANAQGHVSTQQQQVESMITRGVEVLILGAIDARAISSSVQRAEDAGIPVVAYDRLAEGPISGYVSFDNVQVGRLQGEALLRALGTEAAGADVVMMNGSPTDPNAALFREGAVRALTNQVDIVKEYDTPGYNRDAAFTNMSGAVVSLGPEEIDAVYAANDSLASGVIAALKAANVEPLPPVTGQDAELSAIQLIVSGDQYMTVYKPFRLEAEAAAEMAVALGRGEPLAGIAGERVSNDTAENIPAVLATPVSVTVDDIEETVVKDGLYTVDQICTPRYESACERAGLSG